LFARAPSFIAPNFIKIPPKVVSYFYFNSNKEKNQ